MMAGAAGDVGLFANCGNAFLVLLLLGAGTENPFCMVRVEFTFPPNVRRVT